MELGIGEKNMTPGPPEGSMCGSEMEVEWVPDCMAAKRVGLVDKSIASAELVPIGPRKVMG